MPGTHKSTQAALYWEAHLQARSLNLETTPTLTRIVNDILAEVQVWRYNTKCTLNYTTDNFVVLVFIHSFI